MLHRTPKRNRRNETVFALTAAALFIVFVIITFPRHRSDQSEQQANTVDNTNTRVTELQIDDPLPVEAFTDASGAPVSVTLVSASKLVVLSFWSAKCSSCQTVVRTIDSLVDEQAPRATFYAVNRGDTPDVAKNTMNPSSMKSTMLFLSSASAQLFSTDEAAPTAYFIRKGIVVGIGIGALTADQVKAKIIQLSGGA